MAAITMPIGPVSAVSTPPMPPICATIGPRNPDITPTASITPPIPVMSLPIIINTGAMAATTARILTISSACPGVRFLIFSATFSTTAAAFSTAGAKVCAIVAPAAAKLPAI